MPASVQSPTLRLPLLHTIANGGCSEVTPPDNIVKETEYQIDLAKTLLDTDQAFHRIVGEDNSQKRKQNLSTSLVDRAGPFPLEHVSLGESSTQEEQACLVGPQLPIEELAPSSEPACIVGPQLPTQELVPSSEPTCIVGPQLPTQELAPSSEPACIVGPQLPTQELAPSSEPACIVAPQPTTTERSSVSAKEVSIHWSKKELRILEKMCSDMKSPLGKELSEKLPKKTLQAIRNRIEKEGFFKGNTSKWSKKELEEFEKLHSSNKERPSILELALTFPCRTLVSIREKKRSLNPTGCAPKKWLPEQIETLKEMYSGGKTPTDEELHKTFPDRRIENIHRKRKKLKIGEIGPEKWSQKELKRLSEIVSKPKKPSNEILSKTFPGRSLYAISIQVCKLGTKELKKKKWSKKEDQLLKSMCCSKKTPSEKDFLEVFTDRTTEDIQLRRFSLKLIKFPPKEWTQEEVEKLREVYSRSKAVSFQELHLTFPGRTYPTILKKKNELKITNNVQWSQEDDKKLIDMCSEGKNPSTDELCKAFPDRTYHSIASKRMKLGLKKQTQFHWTSEEKKRLEEMCSNERNPSKEELERAFPNRTILSINRQKSRLKLTNKNMWTEEEAVKLRSLFSKGAKPTEAEFYEAFPGRTMEAAKQKLRHLSVK